MTTSEPITIACLFVTCAALSVILAYGLAHVAIYVTDLLSNLKPPLLKPKDRR